MPAEKRCNIDRRGERHFANAAGMVGRRESNFVSAIFGSHAHLLDKQRPG
jgi:hypothetical protein